MIPSDTQNIFFTLWKTLTIADKVFIVLIITSSLFLLHLLVYSGSKGSIAIITVDNKETKRADLGKDTHMKLSGKKGATHLEIKSGSAWISSSSCPKKICVQMGKASRNGDLLVCIPNKIIIQISENEADPQFDGIAH